MNNVRSAELPFWALKHRSLTIGFSLVSFLLFVLLSVLVLATGAAQRGDERVLSFFSQMHAQLPAWFLTAARGFQTATSSGMGLITAFLVLFWGLKKRWRRFYLMMMGVGGAELLWLALAFLFGRPRPQEVTVFGGVSLPAYPSGHVMVNVAFYGMLVYIVLNGSGPWARKWRWLVIGGALLMLLLIAANRLLFSAHYASDLAGGFLAGASWTAFTMWVVEWFDANKWN